MNDRRTFLKLVAAAVSTAQVVPEAARQTPKPPAAPAVTGIRKSILMSMLPRERPYAERFAMALEAGFEAIEIGTVTAPEQAAEIREASQKTGLRIHSVMNAAHWRLPI